MAQDMDGSDPPLRAWFWAGLLVVAAVTGLAIAVLVFDVPLKGLS
jgi:hypothetical protein